MNSSPNDLTEDQQLEQNTDLQKRNRSKIIKPLLFLLKIILSLFLIVLIVLIITLFTPAGLKGGAWLAQKFIPELTITNVSGSLLSTTHITGINYSNKNVTKKQPETIVLRLQKFDLSINVHCILNKTACVNFLNLDQLYFKMPLTPSEPTPTANSTPFKMPIDIEINDLTLNNIELHIGDYSAKWDHFKSAAQMHGKLLHLETTSWNNILIQLPAATEPDLQTTPHTNAQIKTQVKTGGTTNNLTFPPLNLPKIDLPINITIDPFDINQLTISQNKSTQHTDYLIDKIALKATIIDQKLQLDYFNIRSIYADLSLKSKLTFEQNWPTDLQLTLQSKEPLNTLLPSHLLPKQRIDMNITGNFSQLLLNIDLASDNQETGMNAKLTADIDLLTKNYPFHFNLKSHKLFWPLIPETHDSNAHPSSSHKNKTAVPKTEGDNKVTDKIQPKPVAYYQLANVLVEGKGSLSEYTAKINAEASGSQIPESKLALNASGNLESATISQLRIDSLGGTIQATAEVNWKNNLSWNTELTTQQLNFQSYWKDLPATLNSHLIHKGTLASDGTLTLDLKQLSLNGSLYQQPLTGQGDIHVLITPGQPLPHFDIKNLELSHYGNKVTINGGVGDQWNTNINVQIVDIKRSMPQLSGHLTSKLSITGKPYQPRIAVDLVGKDMSNQTNKLSNLTAKGFVQLDNPIQADLAINANKGDFAGIVLNKLLLTIKGNEQSHKLAILLDSAKLKTDINLTAQFDRSLMTWQGQIKPHKLITPLGDWALSNPIDIVVKPDQVTISKNCWSQKSSYLCLDHNATISHALGDINLKLKQFPLNTLNTFLPNNQSVTGTLTSDAKISWQGQEAPEVILTAEITAGRYQLTQQIRPFILAWDRLNLTSNLKNNKLNSNLDLQLTKNGKLTIKSILRGINTNAPTTDSKIVIAKLQPALINGLLINAGVRIGGEINSDLALTGSLFDPNIKGLFHWDKLTVNGRSLPIAVDDKSDLKINFSGKSVTLLGSLHSDTNKLSLEGNASWKNFNQWQAKLVTSGKDVAVEVPPSVSLKISPQITINAKPAHIDVTGDINIPWARIIVTDLPPSTVSVSNDVVLLDDQGHTSIKDEKLPMGLSSKVNVILGDDIRVEALGLKTGLIGKLLLTQDEKGTLLNGEINVENGTYTSFGQDLVIQKGQILFKGPVDKPYLRITAIRNPANIEDNVTAGIRVTGLADQPKVSLYSDPSMPDQNKLSYILTGHNLDKESDTSTEMITNLLINLSVSKGGAFLGKLDTVASAFGIKDFQVGTSGSGINSKITVSGYILPGLQLKYGVGVFDALAEFTVRYRIFNNLYIEGVSNTAQAVDLLYHFSFGK